jgi:hypothetical protein
MLQHWTFCDYMGMNHVTEIGHLVLDGMQSTQLNNDKNV